jgi:hypothetical protein
VNASAMHRPACQWNFQTVSIQRSLLWQVRFHVSCDNKLFKFYNIRDSHFNHTP